MNNILVIGSLNTDLETSVDHFPETGETLIGGPLQIHCGGKGNNQAIAAAKLGHQLQYWVQSEMTILVKC